MRNRRVTVPANTILTNAEGVLAIELIGAAQALDFRDFTPGAGTRAAHAAIRVVAKHLDEDRPRFADHNAMAEAVKRCDVLDAVLGAVGPLQGFW